MRSSDICAALQRLSSRDCASAHTHTRTPTPMTVRILRKPVTRAELAELATPQFGDMVKAVVDVGRRVVAIGGELHADEEAALLEDGARQSDLWGVNLYPAEP